MAEPGPDPLLEELAAGREEAFAALYDRFGPELLRVGRVISAPDAEDALQEVFVALVRTRRTLRGVGNLRAYLFTALRRALTRLVAGRKDTLALHEVAEVSSAEPAVPNLEQAVRLERALHGLPLEQRELVALKVDGGLTFAEISHVLGISANTAASRYRYALEKLRAALEDWQSIRVKG